MIFVVPTKSLMNRSVIRLDKSLPVWVAGGWIVPWECPLSERRFFFEALEEMREHLVRTILVERKPLGLVIEAAVRALTRGHCRGLEAARWWPWHERGPEVVGYEQGARPDEEWFMLALTRARTWPAVPSLAFPMWLAGVASETRIEAAEEWRRLRHFHASNRRLGDPPRVLNADEYHAARAAALADADDQLLELIAQGGPLAPFSRKDPHDSG